MLMAEFQNSDDVKVHVPVFVFVSLLFFFSNESCEGSYRSIQYLERTNMWSENIYSVLQSKFFRTRIILMHVYPRSYQQQAPDH